MKITISGAVGSGKSTISRALAEKLGYAHYSMGELMRDIANKRGININELSALAETDRTIDEELDDMQKKIGEREDNFVMDSRLGFFFIPDSVKIFFTIDLKEAARRIMGDVRKEETYSNVEEAMKFLKKRMRSENVRYKEYYNIDFPKRKYFDIIIDTTKKNPNEVVKEIEDKLAKVKKS